MSLTSMKYVYKIVFSGYTVFLNRHLLGMWVGSDFQIFKQSCGDLGMPITRKTLYEGSLLYVLSFNLSNPGREILLISLFYS